MEASELSAAHVYRFLSQQMNVASCDWRIDLCHRRFGLCHLPKPPTSRPHRPRMAASRHQPQGRQDPRDVGC